MILVSYGKVDIGLIRKTNQDNIFICDTNIGALSNLYIVADGMGGLANGDRASQTAISEFVKYIKDLEDVVLTTPEQIINFLRRGVNHTNYILYKKSKELFGIDGMGTTFTAATIIGNYIYISHVGDSRAYAINKRHIIQLTIDHSLVQEMYQNGLIALDEMSTHPMGHMITRAIGTSEITKIDNFMYELVDVDYILLCSDGVTRMLTDDELFTIITKFQNNTLEKLVDNIIYNANLNGGHDNIALIMLANLEVN
ncbi:hypothetical protein AN641_05055 [Candidatus Epulonipiscioides gigas]|nr:hypothetical protein AN641_05055 [Epulopiscium sp. SCG-C07WGA-EpuloA2]